MRLKEVKNVEELDILFLGSSHSYRGFDPRIFKKRNYKVFNLGSSAQTPIQTEILVKRYLKKLKPKLVVIEVYPVLFNSDGVESGVDILSNDRLDLESLKMTLSLKNIKLLNTFLFACFKSIVVDKDIADSTNLYKKDTYHLGGFVERELMFYKSTIEKKENILFNKKQLEAFDRVLDIIKVNNLNYVLVQAPVTKAKYRAMLNSEEVDSLIKTKGVYYNFNKLIKLSDSLHFYDSDHLNQNGVTLFNKIFIDSVLERDKIMLYK